MQHADAPARDTLEDVSAPANGWDDQLYDEVAGVEIHEAASKMLAPYDPMDEPLPRHRLLAIAAKASELQASARDASQHPQALRGCIDLFYPVLRTLAEVCNSLNGTAELVRQLHGERQALAEQMRFAESEPAFSEAPPARRINPGWLLPPPFVQHLPAEEQGTFHAVSFQRESYRHEYGEASAHLLAYHLKALLAFYEEWFVRRFPPLAEAGEPIPGGVWSREYFLQYLRKFVPLLPPGIQPFVEEALARGQPAAYSAALLGQLVWPLSHASPRLATLHAERLYRSTEVRLTKDHLPNQGALERYVATFDSIHRVFASAGDELDGLVPEEEIARAFAGQIRPIEADLRTALLNFLDDPGTGPPTFAAVVTECFKLLSAFPRYRVCYVPPVPARWEEFADVHLLTYDPAIASPLRQGQPVNPDLFCVVCYTSLEEVRRTHGHEAPFCPLVLGNYRPDHPRCNPGPEQSQDEALATVRRHLSGHLAPPRHPHRRRAPAPRPAGGRARDDRPPRERTPSPERDRARRFRRD